MTAPHMPPPRDTLPTHPDDQAPPSIGMAEMSKDGTLRLHLRTEGDDGTIGEALLVIARDDPRYAAMVAHVAGIAPGTSRPLPPFPEPEIDPGSI